MIDSLNLHFVKDFHLDDIKMAKNGCKMAIYELLILIFFLTKLKKRKQNKNYNLCHRF